MSRDTLSCHHQQKLLQAHGIRGPWIQDAEQSTGGPVTVTYLFQSLSGVTVEKTCLGERTLPLVAHPRLHGPLQREGKGGGYY